MIPAITEINFPAYATLHQATVSLQEMGERTISTQVRIDGDIAPSFDDWELRFKGERFILPHKDPQAAKDNTTRNSLVDLTFTSWANQELKRYFFFEPTSVNAGTVIADKYQASVNLNIEDFVPMLNQVLDYYFDGKIVASLYMSGQGIYSLERSSMEIDHTYLWDVIVKMFEVYGVRWKIVYNSTTDVYTIQFGYPADRIDDHDFEYGYQGGLLRFERQVQDADLKNILLGRGGEKNLPYRYFKRTDETNESTSIWAADPDAIPELANIYFDRLRDINFRWYVRGWMQNPRRDTSWEQQGYVYPTYSIQSDSPYYFAYEKGRTDEKFNPVEYVKDDASIAEYGERWGALEDNDEIFPTIQGRSIAGIGRIDETVDVSEIVTDDIDAAARSAAIERSIAPMTISLNADTRTQFELRSEEFTVPAGSVGEITYIPLSKATENGEYVYYDTDNTRLVAVSVDSGTEYPFGSIPQGRYYLKLYLTIFRDTFVASSATGTFGIEGIVLTTSAMDIDAWKPTFDIWVKNIWQTTQGQNENDVQYAERVWLPILGDRAGNEAKVVFSSGMMSISQDYEFTIASYPVPDRSKVINGVPSEWKITLRKSDAEFDATGLFIPNASTGGKPIAGDYFFFIGIDMPNLYVRLAEEELNAAKAAQLETETTISPTWIINLDKVRVHTLEDGEYGQTLADRLAAGATVWITDPRFTPGQRLQLYVQSITYTWNEPSDGNPYLVPDIEVVLSDKVIATEGTVTRIQNEVEAIKTQYAKTSDIEAAVRRVAEPIFLKKTGESDSSDSPTTFSSKITSKGFRQGGIGGTGWGIYRDNIDQLAEAPAPAPATRALRAVRLTAADEPETNLEGDTVIEVDKVIVRKEMHVNSLVINQIAYVGGKEIISAAKMEASQVVENANSYTVYFDQKQNSVANLFQVGDIAYGQRWSADESTTSYYKMVVSAVDVNSITLDKSPKDGSGIPAKGDVIVQYGNTTNVDRQYVIVRDVIGGGYERMLSGLNSVSSTGKEYYFAGRQNNSGARWFVGDSLGDYAEYEDGVLTIKANVIFKAGQEIPGLSELSGEVSELSGDVDEMSQELIAFNQALGGLTTDVDALEYLKTALPKSDTIISGGLILSKVIALRDSNNVIKSGINGDPTLSTIAAWYGGPMADKEASPTPASYAQTLFRFDGSGYLAGGNIFWNNQGYGGIPGVTWSRINGQDVVSIGANVQLESLQGADSSVTDLIDAVNSLADLFEVVNGNVHVKNNRGFYSDSFISAGGLSDGGGTAGGNASMQLISGGGRITNGTDTLDVYSMSRVDQLLASAGTVQTVAGVSPSNGDIPVASLQTALSLGAAAYKAVGSVVSGNTGLVTGGSVYSAINEAVSSVLKMQGTTTTAISDGSTTNPIVIDGSSYTAKKGDVVMYSNKEFWWTGSAWEELGDEASWALKTTTISAGTGLTGGGTLASNRTISLSDSTIASLALADTALQSHQTIYALTIKNSAGTTQLTYTPNVEAGSITLTKAMVGLGNVDNLAASGYFTLLENSSNQISLTIGGTNKKLTVAYATKALQDSAGNQISNYYLPKATFDDMFEKVALSGGGYAIKAKYGLYTDQFLSAGGLSSGGGAAGGDTSMVVSGNVATFTSSSATFQTYSKNYIDNAISGAGSVGSIKLGTVEYTPDSNKVVNLPAYPTSLPASDVFAWAKASTKPSYAFSEITGTASASQIPDLSWNKITSEKPTTLSGYGITDAKIANGVITLGGNTITPLTSHQTVTLASGTNNGTLKLTVGSTTTDNIAVKGLGSMAYETASNYVTTSSGYYDTVLANNAALDANALTSERVHYTTAGDIGSSSGGWSNFPTGVPSGSFGLLTLKEGGYPIQLFHSYYSADLWFRYQYYVSGTGKTWVGWKRIWNEGNDGASSGLDADLLDGQHGSYYATASSVSTLQGYFTNGVANSAAKLTTVSKTAWGRTYWTANGVPDNVSGDMTDVGKMTFTAKTSKSTSGNVLEVVTIDGVTYLHSVLPFVSDSFISAGGVSSGGGTSGVDLTAVWNNLIANTGEGLNKKIHTAHLPTVTITGTNISGTATYSGTGGSASTLTLNLTNSGVRSTTINGNYLRVNTDGTNADLTIPYATSAIWLTPNYALTYGASGLQYFYISGTEGTSPSSNVTPTSGWYHILRMNHGNSDGYFFDIAAPLNSVDGLYWRQVRAGTNYGWYRILDANNYTTWINSTNFPGLNGNQTITLSGDVSGSGTTSISVSIGSGKVTNAMLAGSIENSKLNTIGVAKGGTGLTTWTGAYRLVYSTAATTLTTLAPNSTTTRKFLRQVGANNAATAPAWDTVTKTDVGLSNVENTALSTWAGTSSITTLGTITTGVWHGSAIGNSYLANSSITINGSSTSLGGSFSTASITAGTAGQSSASTGVSFSIPYVTMNKYGIVTAYGTHTHTISASDLTTTIGSTTYAAYHAAGYVKKDGDTMTSSARAILTLNQDTTSTGVVGPYVWFQVNGTSVAGVGSNSSIGVYLENDNANGHPYVNLDNNGVFKYNNTYTFWHSGNSNLSTVPWACSTLTASGNATIAGNAGIGTTTPGAPLEVLNGADPGSAGHITAQFLSYSPSPFGIVLRGYSSGAHAIQVERKGTSSEFFPLILQNRGGNVGIGTTSPSQKLHVAGNILATGAITAGAASDARLKTNISTLSDSDAKALIMALRPVSFTWNDKATELYDQYKGDDLGFVAQEVEGVLPMAIGTIFEKYKRLDQTKFIAPLVAVAQDHEARIKALEAENAELKRRLNMN